MMLNLWPKSRTKQNKPRFLKLFIYGLKRHLTCYADRNIRYALCVDCRCSTCCLCWIMWLISWWWWKTVYHSIYTQLVVTEMKCLWNDIERLLKAVLELTLSNVMFYRFLPRLQLNNATLDTDNLPWQTLQLYFIAIIILLKLHILSTWTFNIIVI